MCMYANQLQIIIKVLEHNFAKAMAEKISKFFWVRTKQSFEGENLIPISFWLISAQPREGKSPCRGTPSCPRSVVARPCLSCFSPITMQRITCNAECM